ncbi:7-cyano-7-deazaguanine synthase [Iodidimonas nitroreducens]|uniref:7-cyano-7-deazaguanine synthase n=1 Tax=Iodidimonas nitroreducens TaxID=1236968 RepID=A0A5A7N9W8_9PROT|nr:7-cyano-7-deazaguanine synthase QueC [Iodidimonas nitroreducens]GAK34163.1 7-cyano-7-deazaguanine synthase [alpha proteobacterium Q-1]GER05161.1 7-cyano-7-deazaguanine synthase [Iodidimonas nitroreducens]
MTKGSSSPGTPAILLLSGGLDSATVGAMARADGFALHALSFDYGQRHKAELQAADRVAKSLDVVEHKVAHIDLALFGGSALTADIDVPKGRTDSDRDAGIPITYVPARNTIFLSYALAFAEVREARHIFIGVNAVDFSGYPDCRPDYIKAYETMANLATVLGRSGTARIEIRTPLLHMSKAEIVAAGTRLDVDYAQTTSCYDPDEYGRACGACDACFLRREGFAAAGIADPTRYKAS